MAVYPYWCCCARAGDVDNCPDAYPYWECGDNADTDEPAGYTLATDVPSLPFYQTIDGTKYFTPVGKEAIQYCDAEPAGRVTDQACVTTGCSECLYTERVDEYDYLCIDFSDTGIPGGDGSFSFTLSHSGEGECDKNNTGDVGLNDPPYTPQFIRMVLTFCDEEQTTWKWTFYGGPSTFESTCGTLCPQDVDDWTNIGLINTTATMGGIRPGQCEPPDDAP